MIKRFLLRLLVPLSGHDVFLGPQGFKNVTLAHVLGLGDWVDPIDRDFDPKAVRIELRRLHQRMEGAPTVVALPTCLGKNIDRLSDLVGLSDLDCRILEFAVLIHSERLLEDTSEFLGYLTASKAVRALAVLLARPEPEVQAARRMDGILSRSGLVSLDRNGTSELRSRLDLLSFSFADHISSSEADPMSLLRETVSLATRGDLEMTDYAHISALLDVLRPYLKTAVATGRKGTNVYIYGPPGTGKTQLAKALAKEIDCDLFEIASEDRSGDPIKGEPRLRAFRAAQSFFGKRPAILLFDECEDVFNGAGFARKSTAQMRKAWVNRMLEVNPVPTLWLSNSIDSLDEAFIRRFDMVVELPVPPKKQRERIIQAACSDLIDAAGLARIAEAESLAPALVTRAASVVRSVRDTLGKDRSAQAVELLISTTLQAQGHKAIQRNDPNRLPGVYDPALINVDANLLEVAAGLVKTRSARLCLYGPTGTGKTAFGRWLSEQLGVPLLVRRASDLMSMWVGGNEKNIARAFKQAEQDGCLFLIDEVDSFLQDRRGAHRGWEVSMVNEMLTQMEAFAGVLIASTNLMEGLNQAALRRFDLKVRFDFLKPDQAGELLRRHCLAIGVADPREDELARLRRLGSLTPGDFAAVARRNRFRPIESCGAFVCGTGSRVRAEVATRFPHWILASVVRFSTGPRARHDDASSFYDPAADYPRWARTPEHGLIGTAVAIAFSASPQLPGRGLTMATRPDTQASVILTLELMRRIPRRGLVTAAELHVQLVAAGIRRGIRTVQRQLDMISEHFDVERDDRSKPYGYRWKEHAKGMALPMLSAQESLLLTWPSSTCAACCRQT